MDRCLKAPIFVAFLYFTIFASINLFSLRNNSRLLKPRIKAPCYVNCVFVSSTRRALCLLKQNLLTPTNKMFYLLVPSFVHLMHPSISTPSLLIEYSLYSLNINLQ